MITGVHTMFYTSEPGALRAFFRDKFGLKFTDVGGGWLIFDLPDAELGVHPAPRFGRLQAHALPAALQTPEMTDVFFVAHSGTSTRLSPASITRTGTS